MTNLTIKYKKNRLYVYVIIGFIWTGLGVFSLWEADKIQITNFIYTAVGLLYIAMATWNYKYHYLTLTNDFIKNNSLFGKKNSVKGYYAY